MIIANIQLKGVKLALDSAKIRCLTNGRTALFCALSTAPLIRVDCNTNTRTFAAMRDLSIKSRRLNDICGPMQRGHIRALIQRTRDRHGIKEIRKTFGVGIRTLKDECSYIINGGAA